MTTHRVYTTPLPKKLGIVADMHVALIAAPNGFEETLGELPPHFSFTTRLAHRRNWRCASFDLLAT
jgi:hypothetical protein